MRLTALPENLPVPVAYLTDTSAYIIASAHENTIDEYGAKAEAIEGDEEQENLSSAERDQVLRLLDSAVADAVVTVSWPEGHPLATDAQGARVVYQVGYRAEAPAEAAGVELQS